MSTASPELLVITGDGAEKRHRLNRITTVGRSSECEVVVADADPLHCRIERTQTGAFFVHDLNSQGGTRVAGEMIHSAVQLTDGLPIRVGNTLLVFCASPTQPLPEPPIPVALRYFAPPAGTYWHWSADGKALEWLDGKTIAFRQEVEMVLARVHGPCEGLPRFGAVALLLAACRESWRELGRKLLLAGIGRENDAAASPSPSPPLSMQRHIREDVAREAQTDISQQLTAMISNEVRKVVLGLDRVNALPADLRTRPEAKAILAEVIFEAARQSPKSAANGFFLSKELSADVLQNIKEGLTPEALAPTRGPTKPFDEFLQDIEVLRAGVADLNEERLALRIKTGLDALITAPELNLPPAERARRLLAELREDREFSGLARLAQNLMAAVHVPRALSAPDEMPLGGVSDLSNRGPLDRLLVSELAHDDLTLAVRIALNEAMYLRRESPPRSPPRRRALLLDAGIRLWGVPRVFATAVGLALSATSGHCSELLTFRAADDTLVTADLTTRAGLIEHLEALDPTVHPGAAIGPFLAEAGATEGAVEALLITHEDTLADPDFLAAFEKFPQAELLVGAVQRSGAFRMVSVSASGKKLICEATLDLDAILSPTDPSSAPPLIAEDRDPSLPVIFSLQPFPLLLPHAIDARVACETGTNGLVTVARDGRLMHWQEKGLGARQLTDQLPFGPILGVFYENGFAHVVGDFQPKGNIQILSADLSTGRLRRITLQTRNDRLRGVACHGGCLYLILRNEVDVFRLQSGDYLQTLAIPRGYTWAQGRFFRNRLEWHTLYFDGAKARWHLAAQAVPGRPHALLLFDREGLDGPWLVNERGEVHFSLYSASEPPPDVPQIGPLRRVIRVSRDGHRLLVESANSPPNDLILADLRQRKLQRVNGDPLIQLEPEIYDYSRRVGVLRGHLAGIFAADDRRLSLVSDKGLLLRLAFQEDDTLRIKDVGKFNPNYPFPKFMQVASPPGARFKLKMANWRNGSRAWVDARGLLHLKSHDPSVPELAIVLSDGPRATAAWSSDGFRCGPQVFTGVSDGGDGKAIEHRLRQFIARLSC